MPALDVSAVCIDISLDINLPELEVIFPGGFTLSVNPPNLDVANAWDYGKQFLDAIGAALQPLAPIFNIFDLLIALVKLATAIPDAITSLSPSKITDAIPEVLAKLDAILAMIPPLSIPLMVAGILDVLITLLRGLRGKLAAGVAASLRLEGASLKAEALGAAGLLTAQAGLNAAVDCGQASLDAFLSGLGQGAAPLNRLLGLVALLVELAGLPLEIPTLDASGFASIEIAVDLVDALLLVLENVRLVIPIPSKVPNLGVALPALP